MLFLETLSRVEGPNLTLRLIQPNFFMFMNFEVILNTIDICLMCKVLSKSSALWSKRTKSVRLVCEGSTTLSNKRMVLDAVWSIFMKLKRTALLGEVGSLTRIKQGKPLWRV